MAQAQQDLSTGNYRAVIPISAASMATPKRDATNSVITALLEMFNLVDQSGNALGVLGNPLYVNGSAGGGSAPYWATALGYQQVAATASVVTMTVPPGATFAIVSVEGNDARWRDDGTNPTTSTGFPIYAGANQQFSGDLSTLAFIAQATTTTYNFSYYR